MSNCLFEAAYEEILHRCNCTPSFHQTGIREYPWICTGTKLLCMKSILQRIGKYNVVSMIKVINIKIPSVIVIQQIMRVTTRIVLPLLIKALYKFGCFEGILQRAKFVEISILKVTMSPFLLFMNPPI